MRVDRWPPIVKFMKKVSPEPNTGCWLWFGAHHKDGYGSFSYKGRNQVAHRVGYELHCGEIPAGMNVCHRCDNRACVNPDHLFLGTHQENIADRNAKGRQSRGETHGTAKLTERDVLAIRRLSGRSQREMARDFGVTRSAIQSILRGDVWVNVR